MRHQRGENNSHLHLSTSKSTDDKPPTTTTTHTLYISWFLYPKATRAVGIPRVFYTTPLSSSLHNFDFIAMLNHARGKTISAVSPKCQCARVFRIPAKWLVINKGRKLQCLHETFFAVLIPYTKKVSNIVYKKVAALSVLLVWFRNNFTPSRVLKFKFKFNLYGNDF